MLIAAALAGMIHVLFFVMESLLWTKPQVRKSFDMSEEQAQTTKLLAFNQGFYNLFLALGAFAGLWLIGSGRTSQGLVLVSFTCLCMVAAAIVLASSSPRMLRGAAMQALFPLAFLILAGLRALG